jgi:hypothetical protein
VPQRLFTRIIMRVKVVCTLTRQLSTAASPAVKPFDIESVGGPTRSCRTAQEPPAQRLRVNAERSEPKGSVYAEWRRW